MKRILVPTDFSECANQATEVAAKIARETGARIYLMHIINMPSYDSNSGIGNSHDVAEGLFYMKLAKKKFGELLEMPMMAEVNVVELIQYNSVYESISVQAKENEIDLVVMGSHGVSGSQEFFVGSNTERVVRTCELPVLTIKKKHENFSIKDIVFASNFYEESLSVFEHIRKFAEIFKSRIHLLKVITPQHFETTHFSIKLMEGFAAATKIEDYTINIYNDERIEDGIHHFSEDIGAELIAMETHGRSGIQHLLWGSITEGVANHATIPVLSVRIPKHMESNRIIFPD